MQDVIYTYLTWNEAIEQSYKSGPIQSEETNASLSHLSEWAPTPDCDRSSALSTKAQEADMDTDGAFETYPSYFYF